MLKQSLSFLNQSACAKKVTEALVATIVCLDFTITQTVFLATVLLPEAFKLSVITQESAHVFRTLLENAAISV